MVHEVNDGCSRAEAFINVCSVTSSSIDIYPLWTRELDLSGVSLDSVAVEKSEMIIATPPSSKQESELEEERACWGSTSDGNERTIVQIEVSANVHIEVDEHDGIVMFWHKMFSNSIPSQLFRLATS